MLRDFEEVATTITLIHNIIIGTKMEDRSIT